MKAGVFEPLLSATDLHERGGLLNFDG